MIKELILKLKCNFLIVLFIIVITLLLFVNLFALLSISGGGLNELVVKQIIINFLSLTIIIICSKLSISLIFKRTYYIYIFILLILIATQFIGYKVMGAKRWINLGFVNVQPSEFMKIAVILALAKFFHDYHINDIQEFKYLLLPVTLVLLPTIFILKQPNLGTSLIIVLTSINIFFIAGIKMRLFAYLFTFSILSLPIIWKFLHSYQKNRVLTFLDPTIDVLGAGYNVIQSIVSIGSGGLYGKGFLQGSQNQLYFLPENHTDFIFGLVAEEGGFIICVILLITYCSLILSLYCIALQVSSHYSRIFLVGFASLLFFHILINISMISGLVPVTGVPLPLLSYGGSNYFAIMAGVGITINISFNKNKVLSQNIVK